MFVIRIWNYLRGYAIIIVEGLKIERFINLSIINGIYIWDIKKQNYTTIKAKIGLENFSQLREIVKKTNSSVRIVEKKGFPFLWRSIKRKKIFSLTCILILAFIYYITSHIWMIDVVGVNTVDKQIILQSLYDQGLREGISKSLVNKKHIENQTLINITDLSWVGISIKGTKAVVEVVEREKEPPIISKTDYCDIIAKKSGIINRILVLNGDGLVKDGDTVKKGEILVTGTILREGLEERYVHSIAQVTARTWYEDAEEMALNQIQYKLTGKSITKYNLNILNKNFSRQYDVNFEEYNKFEEEKNLLSFGDYIFPIKIIKSKYEELVPVQKKLSVEEAKARCAERLIEKIKLKIPQGAVILNKKIDYYEEKDRVKAKITVEVMEEIGLKQKITGNTIWQ